MWLKIQATSAAPEIPGYEKICALGKLEDWFWWKGKNKGFSTAGGAG